jgi:hypothetical protein
MSGQRLTRGNRLARKAGTAAVTVALTGIASTAFAGKPGSPPPPPPPPPPPTAPAPAPLNLDPDVHWFASWDLSIAPGPVDYFATPSNISGVANMQTQLSGSAAAGKPLGIKIEGAALSSANASTLFNAQYSPGSKAISYVFTDFEGGTKTANLNNALTTVNQVRGSTWSKNAYVGMADVVPLTTSDSTRRGPLVYTKTDYDSAKLNMANTQLFPGASSFRNTSTSDWSNANIRTGLFVGPVSRFTAVQDVLNTSYNGTATQTVGLTYHKQIPYVARFNNWLNPALDTDRNSANGYQFVPGAPMVAAPGLPSMTSAQTANQMMGRGDFSAQILHYRMRGAYSVMNFTEGPNSGVVGYSSADQQQDVRDGWYGGSGTGALAPIAHANNIFKQSDNKLATMTLNPIVDGTTGMGNRSEVTGTIWSGVYSLSLKQLDILASNLDSVNHLVKFGSVDVYDVFTASKMDGSNYVTYAESSNEASLGRNAMIDAATHKLLEFELKSVRVYNSLADYNALNKKYKTQTVWLLTTPANDVFGNNNRNDVGIPEPTTFGMLAAAGSMAVICRRNRRKIEA